MEIANGTRIKKDGRQSVTVEGSEDGVVRNYQAVIGSAYVAYDNTLPMPIYGELSTAAGEALYCPWVRQKRTRALTAVGYISRISFLLGID
jgi:hypothetical protein